MAMSSNRRGGDSRPLRRRRQQSTGLEAFKRNLDYDHHIIPLEELYERFDTNPESGLTHYEAKKKLEDLGPNVLSSFKQSPRITIFLQHLFGYFAYFVWIGSILSVVAYFLVSSDYLALLLFNLGILVIACIVLSVQETQNNKLIKSFKLLVPEFATVIRESEKLTLRVEDIVLGDLVSVKFGDRIPADMRIIEAHNFKVDVSIITNETEPAVRGPENTNENPLDAKNVVFFSSPVIEGHAKGIVISRGDNTHIGRIAGLTCSFRNKLNPMAHEFKAVLHFVTGIGFVVAILAVLVNLKLDQDWIDVMVLLIGIFYGTAPHVLFTTISACLSLQGRRMIKKNCLVKKFQSLETLGTASILCIDKTGILTQNRMSVSHMWYDNKIFEAFIAEDRLYYVNENSGQTFEALARAAILCNRAEIKVGQEDIPILKKEVSGDTTEAAILKYMEVTVGDVMVMRKHYPKEAEIPFNRSNKFQLSIHKDLVNDDGSFFLVMKGAPERIIDRCDTILLNNTVYEFTTEWRNKYLEAFAKLGNMGEKVLAFCDFDLPKEDFPFDYQFKSDEVNFPTSGFRLVGMISLVDPPRNDVPTAVQLCRSAGIKLVMITGDNAMAATAFAKTVGIISGETETLEDISEKLRLNYHPFRRKEATSAVVLGNNPVNLQPIGLEQIFENYNEVVFARTAAQNKLAIVECCQRFGAVVAVTGVGINDSPALKKSDVSASLGISGSHVCKEVADVILLDDSFVSLVAAIRESRLCFENLKKTLAYSLTSTVPQLLPFLLAFGFDFPWPLNLFTVLCIKIGTDLFPAISLIFEEEDADIMTYPPRDPYNDHIVNSRLISLTQGQIGMIQGAAAMFAYFTVMAHNGFFPKRLIGIRSEWESKAVNDLVDSMGQEWNYEDRMDLLWACQTAVFISIVIVQAVDLIICRTRRKSIFHIGMKNYILNLALIVEIALAIFFAYCPGVYQFLQMSPIQMGHWLPAIPFAILIFAYDEVRRYIIRKKPGCWLDQETSF